MASRLYASTVIHERFRPKGHRLSYRVLSMLIDLDEIGAEAARLCWFSVGRFNLFGFSARDHGPKSAAVNTPAKLKVWIAGELAARGHNFDMGAVRLLCFPRLLNFTFSPLSVWFCYDRQNRLRAVLHEVRNTFGEWHGYLFDVPPGNNGTRLRQSCDKAFYVSPFMDMNKRYNFSFTEPDQHLSFVIRETETDDTGAEQDVLVASQTGHAEPLTDRSLLRLFIRRPLFTLKVVLGIHTRAVTLVRQGFAFHKRPPLPPQTITHIKAGTLS